MKRSCEGIWIPNSEKYRNVSQVDVSFLTGAPLMRIRAWSILCTKTNGECCDYKRQLISNYPRNFLSSPHNSRWTNQRTIGRPCPVRVATTKVPARTWQVIFLLLPAKLWNSSILNPNSPSASTMDQSTLLGMTDSSADYTFVSNLVRFNRSFPIFRKTTTWRMRFSSLLPFQDDLSLDSSMCDSKTLSTSSLMDSTLNQSEIILISSDSDGNSMRLFRNCTRS